MRREGVDSEGRDRHQLRTDLCLWVYPGWVQNLQLSLHPLIYRRLCQVRRPPGGRGGASDSGGDRQG